MSLSISACIICYNQEQFINETIDSALKQQIDHQYEVIVGDDVSTDSTSKLIEIAQRNHEIIVRTKSDRNLGMHGNWARCIKACTGDYIALCEGDDFWNDPLKLQKQVDLLEANPTAAACFSNAYVVDENGNATDHQYVSRNFDMLEATDFFHLNINPIPTCTLVFRKSFFDGFPQEYYNSPFADWILHTLLIQKGPYVYLPEPTSSYRKHEHGVWSGIKAEKQLLNKLKALTIIKTLVADQYKSAVRKAIIKQLDDMLYFYRKEKNRLKYFTTWAKLKLMQV